MIACLLGLGPTAGCDFFQELESLPEAGESGEAGEAGESGETGTPLDFGAGEACTVLDDVCPDQDTLHACDAATGELLSYSCATMCAQSEMLNFTCTPTADFSHGCWCAQPGQIKIDTCVQLEACLVDCGEGPGSACAFECFKRTDAQTVRLLGTLYHCADQACDPICASSPADCGICLLNARAGLFGDCGVEREVCNADQGDEPSWP